MIRLLLTALLLLLAQPSHAQTLALPSDGDELKAIVRAIEPNYPASKFCRREKDPAPVVRVGQEDWAKLTLWNQRICTDPNFDDDSYQIVLKRKEGGDWTVACEEQRGDLPDYAYYRVQCGGMPKVAYEKFFNVAVTPDKAEAQSSPPGPDATREEYLARMVKMTREHFDLLPLSIVGNRRGTTTLGVLIKKDGAIVRISVTKTSGYPDIDNKVEQMVSAVGRYPPLPSWYQGETMELTFNFKFPDALKPVSAHVEATERPLNTPQQIAEYCQKIGHSNPTGEGNNYPGIDATIWRCENKEAYVCNLGATGRQCRSLNTSVIPNDRIRDYCRENPGASIVPMAVAGDYAAYWKCQGTDPTITGAEAVDSEGYIRSAWRQVPNSNSSPDHS